MGQSFFLRVIHRRRHLIGNSYLPGSPPSDREVAGEESGPIRLS